MPGGVPEWGDSRWRTCIADQSILQGAHRELAGLLHGFQRESGSRAGSLTDIHDQGLQPSGSVGHVTGAESLVSRQKVVDGRTQQRSVRDTERCTGPAATPTATFGSQRPVIAGVMVIVGVIPHRDRLHYPAVIDGGTCDRRSLRQRK